jgi:hypothetical protein
MRLTWRDGAATVLAGAVVAVAIATTQDLGLPLLGSTRAGVGVLFVLGYAMCTLGFQPGKLTSVKDLITGPFMLTASVLGVIALVLAIVGIIVTSETVLVALTADLLAAWVVTTTHHAVTPARPVRADQPSEDHRTHHAAAA